ncbi:MAG: potassium-transporting ATPase subunit KdpA [Candidatus Omnitrophica bacterium]|nr:potassium-transporting ATPase subunit KdpA [Candidatus Omnitrophota bacterium]
MIANIIIQCFLYFSVLLICVKPLGMYMAKIYEGEELGMARWVGGFEKNIYKLLGVGPDKSMGWKTYAAALMLFNCVGLLVVYGIQRLQHLLPFNPMQMSAVTPDSSFNTAVSFASNTNWQGYGGETTMSYFTQMLALGVQNFVSAATGMATLVALIRGFVGKQVNEIGNFWVDLVRSVLYILLPLSFVLSLLLVSQGVVQTFSPSPIVSLVENPSGNAVTEQTLAVGPAASQIAIKQLGTNGGGFFNVNSAHPFENPTPLSNFLEMISILLIPAALCYTFGVMVRDKRQGWALLIVMSLIFIPCLLACVYTEQFGNPVFAKAEIDQAASSFQAGGNMEGKEARFGIVSSSIWATATTAASNGSVNAMHDSFTPLGGLIPMWMMQLGEVVFGGVGSGLYGMIAFAIIAVFVAGLMVGRTPEYLGKKIEAYEMKMASIIILVPCALVLLGTAIAVVSPGGKATIFNPGIHGFSEVLYAFSSAANNNGSAFAGLGANNIFYNITLGIAMFLSRYWLAIPTLAIAGSLARKKIIPVSPGTLPTHTPLFIFFLTSIVIIIGALTFFPALALGPIAEHLMIGAL